MALISTLMSLFNSILFSYCKIVYLRHSIYNVIEVYKLRCYIFWHPKNFKGELKSKRIIIKLFIIRANVISSFILNKLNGKLWRGPLFNGHMDTSLIWCTDNFFFLLFLYSLLYKIWCKQQKFYFLYIFIS